MVANESTIPPGKERDTMQELPHHYHVTASAESEGNVALKANDVPQLITAPPAEFGGPGDQWSPETLLVGAVANCYILTFRAIVRASKLEWSSVDCSAEGILERVDRVTRFTSITVKATLTVPADTDAARAKRLLEKAEAVCLISNSLSADTHLEAEIIVES
jgi:peroxiredoxin-like protein